MKIGINHTRYASSGGVERYLYNLVNHLLAAGHEVHYYCYKWEPSSHPHLFFHRVPYVKGIRSLKILSFAFFSKVLLKWENFDLILGFGKTYFQDIYRDGTGCLKDYQQYSLPAIRNPVRRLLRKISFYQMVIQSIENKRFREGNFRKIVANSEFVRGQILSRHKLNAHEVVVIYSGADCDHFTPVNKTKYRDAIRKAFGIGDGDILLLFLGNDFMRKALDTVLKVMPSLLRDYPFLKLLVVGKDRHEKRFKDLASSLKITKEVVFAGHHPDTARFYGAADIFILPSRFDPFPNAVLEAMASGLPVIVSRMSGACELVGGCGLVVQDPNSEAEVKEKIVTLLDESVRREMGRVARMKAEDLDWDRHLEKILSLCAEVYQEKKKDLSRISG